MAKGVNIKDLRSKNDGELDELVKSTTSQLFEARFQNYTNRLNDTAKICKLRRELARLKTITSERRHAAQPAVAVAKAEG